jgi:hypothetical protein
MFHLFQTYVASVLSGYCICCNGYTHMLQDYVSPISDICCSNCSMLQVFLLACTVCFICFRCIFHMFHLNVVCVSSGCCKSKSGPAYMLVHERAAQKRSEWRSNIRGAQGTRLGSVAKRGATDTDMCAYVQHHVGVGRQVHSCSRMRDRRGRWRQVRAACD